MSENLSKLLNRITINPQQCGGRPCIRGMRIRVIDVLDLLATGLSHNQVLEELPDLEAEDITASLMFVSSYKDSLQSEYKLDYNKAKSNRFATIDFSHI